MLAIVAMAGIRTKMKTAKVPRSEGPGITLSSRALAMAFMGFSGMIAVS